MRINVPVCALSTATLAAGWCFSNPALAQHRPAGPVAARPAVQPAALPDLDVRLADPDLTQQFAAHRRSPAQRTRRAAGQALERQIDGLTITYSRLWSTPSHVRSTRRLLTEPVAGPFAPEDVVADYVDRHAALFGVAAPDLAAATLTQRAQTPHNRMWSIRYQQTINGTELYGAQLRAAVAEDGRLIFASSSMLTPPPGGFAPPPAALSAPDAVRRAAAELGVALPAGPAVRGQRNGWTEHAAAPGLQPLLYSRFVYFPLTPTQVVPAYELLIGRDGEPASYHVLIDAQTGRLLRRTNLTLHADATYRVFADPATLTPLHCPTHPAWPGPEVPDTTELPVVPRSLVTLESIDPVASPSGWLPEGETTTRGNNAIVYLDPANDDTPDPNDFAAESPARMFDFPIDFAMPPSSYAAASLTQAFYVSNWWHDRMHALGFTEAFENFQDDNFGRGGFGDDAVHVHVHDGLTINNANFTFMPDGLAPRVQMFLFNGTSEGRDGSLDTVILIHELTHGLVTRLIGFSGSISLFGGQPGAMNEGWGDFFGLALLADPTGDPSDTHAAVAYVTRGLNGLTQNRYFGIRRFPYSTDFAKNPLTYNDIDNAQYDVPASVPASPLIQNPPAEVHAAGEVWCTILWECRAELIAEHGPSASETMLQLVTDGLKLTPGDPSFVDARDAILLADLVTHNGAHLDALWRGFARRGLGAGALSPTENNDGVVESFDVPATPMLALLSTHEPLALSAGIPQVRVAVADGVSGPVSADTALVVSIDGGPDQTIPMALVEPPNVYEADFPPLACGDTVEWFVTAETAGGIGRLPPLTPAAARFRFTVGDRVRTSWQDDFETDQGWVVGDPAWGTPASGQWERVAPEGNLFQPNHDHSPDGTLCYFTDGTIQPSELDGVVGNAVLTSPPFSAPTDLSFIVYHRWFGAFDAPRPGNALLVMLASDGGPWQSGSLHQRNDNHWRRQVLRVADLVTPSDHVQVRFLAMGAGFAEAGVDDVSIVHLECGPPPCPGDADGDGAVGITDLGLVLAAFGQHCPIGCAADLDFDTQVGISDLGLLLAHFDQGCPMP